MATHPTAQIQNPKSKIQNLKFLDGADGFRSRYLRCDRATLSQLSYNPTRFVVWTGWRLIPRTTTRGSYCCRSLHRQCPKVCDMTNYLFSFQGSYCSWDKALKLFPLRHTFILQYVLQDCQGGNTIFFLSCCEAGKLRGRFWLNT